MSAVKPVSLPFECVSPRRMNAASPCAISWRLPSPPATHPSPAGAEDLTEPRFVRADLASRLEVDEVGVRLASTLGELD
jgi:hypothetical protein